MPRNSIEVVLAQRQRCRRAQLGPLVTVEGEVPACRVGHEAGPYADDVRAPQTSTGASQRKLLGAWYTPPALVDTSSR